MVMFFDGDGQATSSVLTNFTEIEEKMARHYPEGLTQIESSQFDR